MAHIYEQFLIDSFNDPKYVKVVKCQFQQSMLFVVCVVCASHPKIGSECINHAKRKILLSLYVLDCSECTYITIGECD